jgi:DNA-binding MarR family transcriptional regulator
MPSARSKRLVRKEEAVQVDAYHLDDDIGYLLGRAYTEGYRNLLKEFSALDIRPNQFVLLAQLDKTGPVSQNHLGRLCGMKPATAHMIVERLAVKGLVTADNNENDQRLTIISMTDAARAILGNLKLRAMAAGESSLRALSASEQESLRRFLKKLF